MTMPARPRPDIRSSARLRLTVAVLVVTLWGCATSPKLQPWHTEQLESEFTAEMLDSGQIARFSDYLALEDRLFAELDERVYSEVETGTQQILNRYSRGSAADPGRRDRDWNRSFELTADRPIGGVLLLHGMSDSPYSLRALGQRLHRAGYHVVGLRFPGHGTAPSGLRHVVWQDMAAAVDLAVEHLAAKIGNQPLHLVGYSTGATLAVNAALDALEDDARAPDSLVLISPAIRIHSAAALAGLKNSLADLPGLDRMAYLDIMEEFDPFKYNSFATNAGAQVHGATRHVVQRIRTMGAQPSDGPALPPTLVFKSAVDATVTTEAVVDNLLQILPSDENELVLFDINRHGAVTSTLLVNDPGPFTQRLINTETLPFGLTLIANESTETTEVVARYKAPGSTRMGPARPLGQTWPPAVVSLSHVALPFPPDDPLYGSVRPDDSSVIYLGNLSIRGERGLLRIPENWLLRLRFNPFYDYLEERVLGWMEQPGRPGETGQSAGP
jgi:alpha-beta hydrolase superfamily lysophospholipase